MAIKYRENGQSVTRANIGGGGSSKRDSSITATPASVTLDHTHQSVSVTLSIIGDGEVTVDPTSEDITVTRNGNTLTISGVDETNVSNASITVTIADTESYWGTSIDIPVTTEFAHAYGVTWDGTATTILTRTDESADFVDPSPAVNNGTGSSPFDDLMPWKGMVKVEDSQAGTLVAVPKFYVKLDTDNAGHLRGVHIADGPKDGYVVDPFNSDHGDGRGVTDVSYVGRYHCATSTYKSTTGVKPAVSETRANFRTHIHALGSDVYQGDYQMRLSLFFLYIVEFADWNSQKTIGYGCGDDNATGNMGYTDAMQYHTGTSAASRTTYGLGTQYRNIEGLWDNVLDWCDGIYFATANIYAIKNPNSFSDSSGGTLIGTRPQTSGYISDFKVSNESGFDLFFYADAVAGGQQTYISDYCHYAASGVVLCVGGNFGRGQDHGLFYSSGYSTASASESYFSSRIQKRVAS